MTAIQRSVLNSLTPRRADKGLTSVIHTYTIWIKMSSTYEKLVTNSSVGSNPAERDDGEFSEFNVCNATNAFCYPQNWNA